MSQHGRLRSDYKGDKMYLNTGTLIAVMIALATSLLVIIMSYTAHRRLLNKYNLLNITNTRMRQECVLHHVRKPF